MQYAPSLAREESSLILSKSVHRFLHRENDGEVTYDVRGTGQVREHRGNIFTINKARVSVKFAILCIITHQGQ